MLPTRLAKLDEFLSGGIPEGVITDVFGPHGTGKTQFLFQLSANAILEGRNVLYVDTSGSFRPERIVEIQRQAGRTSDTLDEIEVLRVTNTHDQIKSLQVVRESKFHLILIDSITDLFSYEYQNSNRTFEKNIAFMQYMYGLSLHAICKKIPIVVTNTIRHIDGRQIESMQTAIDMSTHIKIRLSRDDAGFIGNASWLQNSIKFPYIITSAGLTDVSEAI
ncbi:MAG: AAA family ATPase [Thaumarchaeota archaeon]|nr:AAA family ATPase [Nitrososphaerota archaeon]